MAILMGEAMITDAGDGMCFGAPLMMITTTMIITTRTRGGHG